MAGISRQLCDLVWKIAGNSPVPSNQRGPPSWRQRLVQLRRDIEPVCDVGTIVENRVAEQHDVPATRAKVRHGRATHDFEAGIGFMAQLVSLSCLAYPSR